MSADLVGAAAAPSAAAASATGAAGGRVTGPPPRQTRLVRGLPLLQVLAVAAAGLLSGVVCAVAPLVGVALVVALALLALSLLRPDHVTLLIVGVIYSNAAVVATDLHGLPTVVAVAVPVALLVPLAHRLLLRRRPVVIVPVLPLVVVFGAVQAASTLTAVLPAVSIAEVVEFVTEGLALFVLVTNTVVGAVQVRRAVWSVLAVGALLGGLSVWQSVTGTYGQDYLGFAQISEATVRAEAAPAGSGVPRLAGPIGETNRYAQAMLVLVPLGLVQVLGGSSRRVRLLAGVATVLITAGVVLTFSRGAAVGLAVVLVVATAMRVVRLRWFLLLCGAILAALPFVPAYTERLATLGDVTAAGDPFSAGGADGAIQGRLTENLAALLAMRDHPLLGVGPGGFPSVYQDYVADLGIRPHEGEREAHNLYAGIGAELGILGLLCFLAIVGVVLRDLVRVRRLLAEPGARRPAWHPDRQHAVLADGFILALVAQLVSGVFLHQAFQRYFWLLLALAACAAVLPERSARPLSPGSAPDVREPDAARTRAAAPLS